MKMHYIYKVAMAAMLSALVACADVPHDGQTVAVRGGLTYRGGIAGGKYEGYGQLSLGDSVVYAGQWHNGQRQGMGVCRDSLGRRVVGVWRADTLVHGVVSGPEGIYNGDLNRKAVASGHGFYEGRDGTLYLGLWRDGMRHGFGFALDGTRHARVGEWRWGRYKGERLQYTTARIYGIDLSRFQHHVGGKTCAIHWDRLRITHLGNISKKNVAGTVDYPVSFCYIKSTEGTTVRNPFYRADYAAARRRGIPCGAYHFFSTLSQAKAQAQFFLKNSSFAKGDFPPVLDLEPSTKQIEAMGGAKALFAAVRTWLRTVEASVGVKPILYVGQSFVNRYLPLAPDIMHDYRVWIARYGEYKPDVHLVFWQLSPDGRVEGISGDVDINVFNGYRSEFEDFKHNSLIK